MKNLFLLVVFVFLILKNSAFSQQLTFNTVLSDDNQFLSMAQDKNGFMWFTSGLKGLQRYDGSELKSYAHDPLNSNSLADDYVECLVIDPDNIFWLGTYGSGLDRFDQSTNTFTHFRHNNKDNSSLSNDTITALLCDRTGNLWVGSSGGLDLLDKKTGKFTHYSNNPYDPQSLSDNEVRVIYEDHSGTIWVGCGRPFTNQNQKPEDGGLNRFNKSTGKFTRYMHDPGNPESIANNKVRAIFEDSKGNFWIGTRDDGLHIMDRSKGTFTHYYYNAAHPEKLSRPPQYIEGRVPQDHIAFFAEDATGGILIGTYMQGINYYNPSTGKVSHYGLILDKTGVISADTSTGLNENALWRCFTSRDGVIWIETLKGKVFNINVSQTTIPYYSLNANKPDINSFYCEPNNNILWLGTDQGLFRKNLKTGEQKIWTHDLLNKNSICSDTIGSIKADEEGKLWVATANGLCLFDPRSNMFTTWRHDENLPKSLSSDTTQYLFIDHDKNIWIGTATKGVDKLDIQSGVFTNYQNNINDKNSISHNRILAISEDHKNIIWIATSDGLNSLNTRTGHIQRYLPNVSVTSVLTDASGVVWAATIASLFRFDSTSNAFHPYKDANLKEEIAGVINILEDNKQNLWLSTVHTIIKIDHERNSIRIYNESNGVHINNFTFADNFVSNNGEIFIGDESGYYAFFPDQVKDRAPPPLVSFTDFKISDEEVVPGKSKALDVPVWDAKKISLNYNQNSFSFEFSAVSYTLPGNKKYVFKLENYNDAWQYIGTDRKAYFFNVPPGNYVLHVKSIGSDGAWGEKTIEIIITPPWWRTWWAYSLFIILLIAGISGFIYYRSRALRRKNRILEDKVTKRTTELKQSLENLRSTQAQLIQSEKMASLGELTAGIAHEIQNPLNFVNNFSEVNTELIDELEQEIDKGNFDDVKIITKDLKDNEQKILHHGKRADAIVKGMLQHSRVSSGQKEPTDINALADEYLRLSYHGLRAKDKNFNATLQTDFDTTIGKINIVPQDVGRVLINLFNNAFYAIGERRKVEGVGYEPRVSVCTKKLDSKIEIHVRDNGIGIPQKVVDKIFQPFFTTKPTGQGTGLGLSLSYDIIKAHGGEIKVETKEGEGSEFIIQLPSN